MSTSALPPDPALGVFETLLVLDGRAVELDAHLARMARSTRELFGCDPPPRTRERVTEHARSLPLGRLRLTVAPGPAGELGADVVTSVVQAADVFPQWDRATELRPFLIPGGLGAHKWADRGALASLEAEVPKGCLPLLLDAGEEVLEASRANVFALDGELLLTPPADGRILPGVARVRAIEAARSVGIEVREQELSLGRLIACTEVFLTGSVRGLEPVRAIEGAHLAKPGEAVREIAASMRRQWVRGGAASWAAAL
jgi:para-aminobenzoate synthetase / 4-amino-4-deoxychorismate lyase